MLNSAVVVLRELIEALLLISVLLSIKTITKKLITNLVISISVGLLAAILFTIFMSEISDMYEGTGQEILISSILTLMMVSILITNACLALELRNKVRVIWSSQSVLIITIALAISIEMTEILVYFEGVYYSSQSMLPNLFGAFLGSGIAMSFSILIYYLLKNTKYQTVFTYTFLSFISAGVIVQSISYLMQSGIVEAASPVFNTNALIREDSIVGQLLYSAFGYESTPTLLQFILFLAVLFWNAIAYFCINKKTRC